MVEEEKEAPPMTEAELAKKAKLEEIQRLRAQEKFITVKTGTAVMTCSYIQGISISILLLHMEDVAVDMKRHLV